MSGPTTVVITAEPVSVLLAAAAIRAARAVREAAADAAALGAEHARTVQARQLAQADASARGAAARAREIADEKARFTRLQALAEPIGLSLESRFPDDPAALAAFNDALEASLREALGNVPVAAEAGLSPDLPIAGETTATAPATGSQPTLQARLLARLAGLGPLPPALAALADELAGCTAPARRESLALELHRAVQAYEAEAAQRASALVLETTLQDLGYQVEPIAETLFVEGGVLHFRRAGWGDYQVRMRLDAGGGKANFNVVRAVDAGPQERSLLDHLAEDRWCAEFPALLQALGERGLTLAVTRRLTAGELPVQQVARDRLPRFIDDEAPCTSTAPRQKALP